MEMKRKTKKSGGNLHLKEVLKKSGKRKVILGLLLLLFLAVAAAAVVYLKFGKGKNSDFSMENMQGGGMQFTISEGMILANGVTNMGITEEVFEVENLTAKLEIEEVYINSEDTIEKGSKVLKLSETDIAEAREELEKTRREADLAYRAGKIEYEQSKITLKYDMDSKALSGRQAEAVYEETLSGLQDSVDKAKKELDEAKEEIAEYQSYVNDNSYKSYFKVDEYQAAYDETLDALTDKMEEWGVSWTQVTSGGGMSTGAANAPSSGSGMSGDAGTSPSATFALSRASDNDVSGNHVPGNDVAQSTEPGRDQIQVLSSLYKVLETQGNKLEQAQEDYEDAVVNAAFELQTLELKIPELEQKVTEAEKNYQTEVLQAKVVYEKALANAASAEGDYEAALRKAETNYEKLKSDMEDAKENLELFEKSVGDGYFYASGSGTVLRTMVRAGDELSAEGRIFVYSNPEEMTVTVSVNQTDIAKIAPEDKVYIQTEEHGAFEGIVTKIDPVSDSDSRTNVTYSVVVKFAGDTEAVSANESVMAVFGMEEDAIRKAVLGAEQSVKEAAPKSGQAPASGREKTRGDVSGGRE